MRKSLQLLQFYSDNKFILLPYHNYIHLELLLDSLIANTNISYSFYYWIETAVKHHQSLSFPFCCVFELYQRFLLKQYLSISESNTQLLLVEQKVTKEISDNCIKLVVIVDLFWHSNFLLEDAWNKVQ